VCARVRVCSCVCVCVCVCACARVHVHVRASVYAYACVRVHEMSVCVTCVCDMRVNLFNGLVPPPFLFFLFDVFAFCVTERKGGDGKGGCGDRHRKKACNGAQVKCVSLQLNIPHIELHSCHPRPPSTPSCPRPLSTPLSLPCLVRVLLDTHSRCTLHRYTLAMHTSSTVFGFRPTMHRKISVLLSFLGDTEPPCTPLWGGVRATPPHPALGGNLGSLRDAHSGWTLACPPLRSALLYFFLSFFLSFLGGAEY